MIQPKECPTPSTLAKWMRGEIDDLEAVGLESHFAACPLCPQTVRNLDATDTLVEAMQSSVRVEKAAQGFFPEVELLLAKLKVVVPTGNKDAQDYHSRSSLESTPVKSAFGQYELLELLGQGGMGAVYKGQHRNLEKVVALKILRAGKLADPQLVSRFEREMRAVGKLNHPNIVAAFDAGQIDGIHYLAMEFVDGVDLAMLMKDIGPLPIAEASELIWQAALGLQHAHDSGLIHRDIKPGNLMLTRPERGQPTTVKLLDLGLALLDEANHDEITSTGQVMGTIDYMAPEQCSDTHAVDLRADLYSLGASLFKLLTGRVPLPTANSGPLVKRLLAMATATAPDIRTLRPDCPAGLAELIAQLLSTSPEGRPKSAAALADRLSAFCGGANLQSLLDNCHRPSSTETTTLADKEPSVRTMASGGGRGRRRWQMIGAAAFSFLLCCAIVIVIWNRDGTKTSLEVQGNPEKVVVTVQNGGKNSVAVVEENQTVPTGEQQAAVAWPELTEPEPLVDWLVDREVITVKQDGTAMFTTIQAALDAQKDGQVVRVLDKGPYRENLSWQAKSNCGLVSDVDTEIVQKEWRLTNEKAGVLGGHLWHHLTNCRVSGFTFLSQARSEEHSEMLKLYDVPGTCIEVCVFGMVGTSTDAPTPCIRVYPYAPGLPFCIRDCVLAVRPEIATADGDRVLLTRNWFRTERGVALLLVHSRNLRPAFVAVQHNVTAAFCEQKVWELAGELQQLNARFRNNSVVGGINNVLLVRQAAGPGITIEENAFLTGTHMTAIFTTQESVPLARESWQVHRNYGTGLPGIFDTQLTIADKQPILMLSEKTSSPNYLRINPQSLQIPAGDPFPGALTPGPAPADGDWFTRLLDRWHATQGPMQQLVKEAP